jgi:murein DD-endopeptidase MepM/ murein hydrolase activator NlpD
MRRFKNLLFLLFALATFVPTFVSAATPKFRRPLDLLQSPAISEHYDHDVTTSTRIYSCASAGTYDGHKGTDFRAPVGTPVFAAAAGGIFKSVNGCPTYGYWGSACGDGYGNQVRIDHEGSETDGIGWITIYGHLQAWSASYPSSVLCGARIGLSGSSGNSTGPHLHFEVRKSGYPYDDPYAGACSRSASLWTIQDGDVPAAECG